jgi:mRNA interferase RelE/StbE
LAYEITYLPKAEKAVARLPKRIQSRVLEQIAKLAENPRPVGSIKLKDSELYRIRVGDYRVLYTIDDGELIVLVVDVANRKDVYRR